MTQLHPPDHRVEPPSEADERMIEEYARPNGHADLLRKRIDGATGG